MIHGGSCIYVKNGISFTELQEINTMSVERVLECSAVKITSQGIIVLAIYRSPTSDTVEFFSKMEQILEDVKRKDPRSNIFVCGDFNVNLLNSEDRNTGTLIDLLSMFALVPQINEPTRLGRLGSATLIDNIFTDHTSCIGKIINTALSDHMGQQATYLA